jgi:hypothetical protein
MIKQIDISENTSNAKVICKKVKFYKNKQIKVSLV